MSEWFVGWGGWDTRGNSLASRKLLIQLKSTLLTTISFLQIKVMGHMPGYFVLYLLAWTCIPTAEPVRQEPDELHRWAYNQYYDMQFLACNMFRVFLLLALLLSAPRYLCRVSVEGMDMPSSGSRCSGKDHEICRLYLAGGRISIHVLFSGALTKTGPSWKCMSDIPCLVDCPLQPY